MKKFLVLSVVLISGCAAEKEAVYWTKKDGVATVHHVGKMDHVEKLSTKTLSKEELAAAKLDKGNYFEVTQTDEQPMPPEKKNESKDKLSEVSAQIRSLKGEVDNVRDENRRLREEIQSRSRQSREPSQPDVAQETQSEESPIRMSQ